MEDNIFNVTSNNQQGGITAGQINIGPPQRHLDDKQKELFETFRDKKIHITTASQDAEATSFAYEIKEYLFENGFDVASFGQTMSLSQIKGQEIQEEKDGSITLVIGTNVK